MNNYNRRFWTSSIVGIALLLSAILIVSLVQVHLNNIPIRPLRDVILDNLPLFPWPDLLLAFLIWGSIGIAISVLVVVIVKPYYFPATTKTIAVFYLVRSLFLWLTNLTPHPDKLIPETYTTITQLLYGSNDLFFSGHVGLPIVASLIFWRIKGVRYYFILVAALYAAGVLFARAHYSIDIFIIPLVVYSLVELSKKIFKEDFKFIDQRRLPPI